MDEPIFNYIITIYNKEDLIEKVLESIIRCSHKNSFIYAVLDGCTDKSEEIVDRVISKNADISIFKIILNDVHEILSINAGLRTANQSQSGYNIILQDDVIILDYAIEDKIKKIYNEIGSQLGYLSFRLGANLKTNIFETEEVSPFTDYVESVFGHGIDNAEILKSGQFVFRDISIKSPVCIPTNIIRDYGVLDEKLAPCFHDDTEYCLRLLKNGFRNGVFSLKYESDLDWGGTRKNPNPIYQDVIKRNLKYLKIEYHNEISNILLRNRVYKVKTFKEYFDSDMSKAELKQYKLNNKKRIRFENQGLSVKMLIVSFLSRVKHRILYKIKILLNI